MCACWAFVHARSGIRVPIWDSAICGCACRQTNSEDRPAALTTPTTHSPLLSRTSRTLWSMPGHAGSGSGRATTAKAIPSTFWTRTATSSKPMLVRWKPPGAMPLAALCGHAVFRLSQQAGNGGNTQAKTGARACLTQQLQVALPVNTGVHALLRHTRRPAAPLPSPPHCPPSRHSALPRACAA